MNLSSLAFEDTRANEEYLNKVPGAFGPFRRVDLHCHTTKSDGKHTVDELVAIAVKKRLEFVAVTDHDYVNREANEKLEQAGIKSCEAVEISARDYENGHSLHVTFYADHIDPSTDQEFYEIRLARIEKIRKQCDQLRKNGFLISFADLEDCARKERMWIDCLSNSHIAECIVAIPYNLERIREILGHPINGKGDFIKFFLKDYSSHREIGWVKVPDYEPSIERVVELARANNAVTSIAHPNFTYSAKDKGIEVFEKRAEAFAQKGITAIEVNPFANEAWLSSVITTAQRTNMILSFGSDSHGIADPTHNALGDIHSVAADHPSLVQNSMHEILTRIRTRTHHRASSVLELA